MHLRRRQYLLRRGGSYDRRMAALRCRGSWPDRRHGDIRWQSHTAFRVRGLPVITGKKISLGVLQGLCLWFFAASLTIVPGQFDVLRIVLALAFAISAIAAALGYQRSFCRNNSLGPPIIICLIVFSITGFVVLASVLSR